MRLPRLSAGVRVAVSVAILVGMVAWVGPGRLVQALSGAHPAWLLAALGATYLHLAIGALNVHILTRALVPEVSSAAIVKAYFRSWAVGMVAPGKIGDLTYAGFLAEAGPNLAPGLAVAVVDKVVTFVVTSGIAVIGLAVYAGSRDALLGAAIAAAMTGIALVGLRSRHARGIVKERLLGSRARHFEGFSGHTEALLSKHRAAMAANTIGTILRTVVSAWATLLALKAFDATAPLGAIVMINAIAQLATLVPISFSGLGVRQGVSVVLLQRVAGVAHVSVLGEQLAMTAISYLNVAICFAVFGGSRVEDAP